MPKGKKSKSKGKGQCQGQNETGDSLSEHGRALLDQVTSNSANQHYTEASAYPAPSAYPTSVSASASASAPHANHSYDPAYTSASYPTMDYTQYGGQYGYPPGYTAQHGQQQQQYQQPAAPQIRNPFAPPPPPAATYAAHNANFDPDYEQQIAQWQSAYAPDDQQDRGKKGGKNERTDNANLAPLGQRGGATTAAAEGSKAKAKADDGKYTVVRKGGGESWEDKTLLQWDPTKFRIMVGNLAGEVTDDSLAKAFGQYGVSQARVIRDKRTTKSKGFGFVEFNEGEEGFRAAREMVGKYIGSHPVTIQRAKTDVKPAAKKDQHKHKGRNNNKKNKQGKNEQDPLKAHTGAGIEKKQPAKPAPGLKLLG